MPTYEYQCAKCQHRLDMFQPMKDKPKRVCPKCKQRSLQRKIGGGAGIIFKGSGFYATDYRKSAPSPSTPSKPAKPDTSSADTTTSASNDVT